jgi:hypothetical protein
MKAAVTGGTRNGLGFGIPSTGLKPSKKTAFKTLDKEFPNLNSLADQWVKYHGLFVCGNYVI